MPEALTIPTDVSGLPETARAGVDALAARALGLLGDDRRIVIGISGSPGAGKTTLAKAVAARVNELRATDGGTGPVAAHLPMDGFHLANATLGRLGRHDRKGAIDTFDGWGFVALVRRLADEVDHTVYAPAFDREVDEGVAGGVAIEPDVRIVFAEGNYLLTDAEPWGGARPSFAETWFCETGDGERLRRLVDRHERHGRTPEEAEAWATTVDGRNAVLIEASAASADVRISGTDASILSTGRTVS